MLLGSTPTELLRGAGCAVLIAPPRAPSDELEGAAEPRDRAVRMQADGAVSALVGWRRLQDTGPAGRVPDSPPEEGTMRIPTNESPLDRALRLAVGAVLGWLYVSGYVTGATAAVVLVVNLLPVTGLVR